MNASSVLLFLVVDGLLVLTPGPDWLYVIARSLQSRRSGLIAVGGICTAYVGYTALVATGLAAAVATVPGVLPVLKYAGAAYLVFLAVRMLGFPPWRKPDSRATAEVGRGSSGSDCSGSGASSGSAGTAAKVFGQSFLTGFLNPKALLLFLSLLPQFADPAAALPIGVQLALLGLLHVLCCGVGYTAVALIAGQAGRRIARSTRLSRVLPVASAALLLTVAAVTAF